MEYSLDWREGENPDEIHVRVIPDRAESARRLLGRGKALSPERDAVAELVAEFARRCIATTRNLRGPEAEGLPISPLILEGFTLDPSDIFSVE